MQSFGLAYTVFFLLATASTHLIAYQWALAAFPGAARHKKKLLGACVFFIVVSPVTRAWMHLSHESLAAWLHVLDLFELMIVALVALPMGLMLLARRTRRKTAAARSAEGMGRRQMIERVVGLGAVGAAGSVLAWGTVRGRYALVVEEVEVKLAGLPRALDGYVIAQVSDIHAGLFVGEKELDDGMARIASLKPDLVVATGDLVDFDPEYARLVSRKLAGLAPRDGVSAILGNHDYYAGATLIEEALRAAGVDVLKNRGRMVRPNDGGGFALLGVDDLWAYRYGGAGPDVVRAASGLSPDAPRVLLSHQPQTVDLWRGQAALQLSGHTHGGQINPGFRPAALFLPYIAGRYDVGGTTLYVNRGFGTAGPPARVGAPPEITKVVLVSA